MPRVSIIILNDNGGHALRACLRSALAQTVQNFDLVIADNGSTDTSRNIFPWFTRDPRVTVREHDENSRQSYSRWNEAAEAATGEWLWLCRSTDAAHPKFLEKMLGAATVNPTATLVFAKTVRMDEEGRILGMENPHLPAETTARLKGNYFAYGYVEVGRMVAAHYLTTPSALLVRRNTFREVGGFESRVGVLGTLDGYLRMLNKHDITYVAEPLVYERILPPDSPAAPSRVEQQLGRVYAIANAYARMQKDARYSSATREKIQQQLKASVNDLFAEPGTRIPMSLEFAANAAFEVIADKRLKRAVDRPQY